MEVLVFKTNIDSPEIEPVIARSLTRLRGITSWSIDFGDRDKVLRVEVEGVVPAEVIQSIVSAGFQCEDLV